MGTPSLQSLDPDTHILRTRSVSATGRIRVTIATALANLMPVWRTLQECASTGWNYRPLFERNCLLIRRSAAIGLNSRVRS